MTQAEQIFNRLTRVEKLELLRHTPAGVKHLACNAYLSDLPDMSDEDRIEVIMDVHSKVWGEFREVSRRMTFT